MRIRSTSFSGYSTLLAMLLIGFMLILTVGVYQLVMREFQDTKAMEYSLKAFSGAEGAVELALLQAKEAGYTVEGQMKKPDILSKALFGSSTRIASKDVEIQYTIDTTTHRREMTLAPHDFHIIPLFYSDLLGTNHWVRVLRLQAPDRLLWNIIYKEDGLSGNGSIDPSKTGSKKTFTGSDTIFATELVDVFLQTSEKPYMMLQNPTEYDIDYVLLTPGKEGFSQDTMKIQGSGEVGGFQQTLEVNIATSEYLNVLKYVIF